MQHITKKEFKLIQEALQHYTNYLDMERSYDSDKDKEEGEEKSGLCYSLLTNKINTKCN